MQQSTALASAATSPTNLRNIADLPGPRGLPLLGNLLQIDRTRVHASVEQWSREYGPLFRFRLASRQFMVVPTTTPSARCCATGPTAFDAPRN